MKVIMLTEKKMKKKLKINIEKNKIALIYYENLDGDENEDEG